ncbi:2TM domain-containing protein [Herbidospora daliensis]|uniref:2TM domain-containing protein n=1 Tax=Herbidospora daliensis TaxID=295585 RepID=UPI000AA7FFB1|nr:2TM domain-containing protein [Herbidospora daliensis]
MSESGKKWGLRLHLLFYVLSNLSQVVVWRLFDSDHFFWPMWSIVFWGIGLAFHYWAVLAPPRTTTS